MCVCCCDGAVGVGWDVTFLTAAPCPFQPQKNETESQFLPAPFAFFKAMQAD